MFEAAIFDWDGTLADTRIPIDISFHRALKEVSLDVSTEYIERRIGIGASDTFREILRSQGRAVDEALVKQLVARKSEIQVELAEMVKLFPGAEELLASLQGQLHVEIWLKMHSMRVFACYLAGMHVLASQVCASKPEDTAKNQH